MRTPCLLLNLLAIALGLFATPQANAQEKSIGSQFRGANHAGIYDENNLLDTWPETGPTLLWANETVGNGYGSATVTDGRIFVQGEKDSLAILFSLDLKGNRLWEKSFGHEMMRGNFPGALSTPTVVDSLVYCSSGVGDIACFKAKTGEIVWKLNMLSDLEGELIPYGFSQSLLVDGDIVYCSPSGKKINIAALNRFTGAVIWTTPATGEGARCSPVVIENGSRKILLTTSETSVLGLDARNGDLLSTFLIDTSRNFSYNTPLVDGNDIYASAFYGSKGVVKLRLSDQDGKFQEIWSTTGLMNSIGGLLKIGRSLIGAHRDSLFCLDTDTGRKVSSIATGVKISASTIFCDGKIYLYTSEGVMMLIALESGMLKEISSFQVKNGEGYHFAHPVIKNRVLYIRHGKALMAYQL